MVKRIRLILVAVTGILMAGCMTQFPYGGTSIQADGAVLEAQLVVPDGGRDVKPAVIFSGGSSPVDFRDYTPGFRETLIEEIFLSRDYAVLYVNKRGLGDSSGNWRWSSIEERAEDTLAAVEHLRTLPGIDHENIGLIGHSQGGWVVQLAGSMDEDLAFVVSLAGPTVSVREQDTHRIENEVRCEGGTEADIETATERLARKHERNISAGRWFPFFSLRYASNIYQYNPENAIRNLTQPTLLAFGELDYLVPPAENYERFDEIFGSGGSPAYVTLHTVANANHGFKVVESMCESYEDSLSKPYSDEFADYLGSWVDGLGL